MSRVRDTNSFSRWCAAARHGIPLPDLPPRTDCRSADRKARPRAAARHLV